MSVTRSQSKDNKKQKEHSDQEDILDTTIMASEQQELSGIDKLLQMMQLQSQRMEQKMDETQQKLDDNQRETKQTMEKNQEETSKKMDKVDQKMEETQRKMDETQQKLDQKMDETKRIMQENQKETKQAIEENNKKMEERIEKYEMKIQDKIKELTNGQKKELENLENKLENAIQVDREEVEKRITEIEKQVTENRTQQNVGERREMVIHSTDDVKIRFGGDVRRLHPVPFINSLKKKIQHIGNFETAKETIRNHLKNEASLWFDCKEEEFDSWQQFEQKFLNYFWGKVQQLEINKELQNGKYNDRIGISERTYALQIYYNAKHLQYNYSSEQLVELIARHFEETLEDHITLTSIILIISE
ncbi:fibronectin-binding protein PlpA-like [Diabrotica virgifera virgifera]|uniref:Uncharacterized protein n=1 Tax=Diabrotica virgifera virgifera TaxID=50390 RepID=A0ABM5K5G0_DIAVI|nr:fibronectin-binding protein PlpA-like [Diabrotica virgifera virgifera]